MSTLAVLPFSNLADDPTLEYFTQGFAEEIATTLGGSGGVGVAPWTLVRGLRADGLRPLDVAARTGAGAVLDGGVRRTAREVYVTAQLTAADGAALWSARFDRPLGDLLAVRAELISRVLGALAPDAATAAAEAPPTQSVAAYDLYLRGHHQAAQILARSQRAALEDFTAAIGLDAAYAQAHAGKAMAHAMLFQYWESTDDHVAAADAASRRSVELAPGLAEARIARGVALSLAKQYEAAERELVEAIRLRPDAYDAHYFLARAFRTRGAMREAAESFERAAAARPDDYQALALLASVYVSLGRAEEAKAAQVRALELADRHLRRYPDDARALYLGAGALASLGDGTKARQWARRALAMDPDDTAVLYNVACAYAILGLTDSALDCLERALTQGFGHWEWIAHDSDLDSLRDTPRFAALLERRSAA